MYVYTKEENKYEIPSVLFFFRTLTDREGDLTHNNQYIGNVTIRKNEMKVE